MRAERYACPICGPDPKIDEDACCATCGACVLPMHEGWYLREIAAAEERGALAMREKCARIAEACAIERDSQIEPCVAAGGARDALLGKLSEALRIASALRAIDPSAVGGTEP